MGFPGGHSYKKINVHVEDYTAVSKTTIHNEKDLKNIDTGEETTVNVTIEPYDQQHKELNILLQIQRLQVSMKAEK